ncbi:MAG: hypothetical protein AUG75_07925 [Cyanobacteria bacterium 13_1_20CM_4_61_6]|nr:MAG: hypothetical protein AUG75_07925 [Cyanobacteria bacterium 13_1_20CM_4_61_6]
MPTMPLNQLAFLSAGWLFAWRKRKSHALIFVHKNGIPFRPGMRPEAEFSVNGNCIYRLLGWILIVLSALSSHQPQGVPPDFIGTRPENSRKD